MATVIVLSKDATMEFLNGSFHGASIDGTGHLVFNKWDGTTVTLGPVTDHSTLLHLSADDHPQYAKADGTRGSFATTAQGTKADAARPNMEAATSFNASGSHQWVERFTVVADGIDSDTLWEDRLSFFWDDTIGGGTPRRVFSLNERFEPRYIPAKENTVGLRGFAKRSSSDTAHSTSVPIQQIMDNEDDRHNLWGIMSDGMTVVGTNLVKMNYVLVLGPSDPVPTGTPSGTVIVRTT
jgi:hypothetical protein